MRLRDWLEAGDLQEQPATADEIARLLDIAGRDLTDAAVSGLSRDRRFAIAYDAALVLSTAALRAAGYRPRGSSAGHHWLVFALLPEIMGQEVRSRSRYYQACRRKRHQATYEQAGVASEVELQELMQEVTAFRAELVRWLGEHHADLAPKDGREPC